MEFSYEIKNVKLKKMVEKKANDLRMSVDELIIVYINRGLINDGFDEEAFMQLHSDKYMSEVNAALNVD